MTGSRRACRPVGSAQIGGMTPTRLAALLALAASLAGCTSIAERRTYDVARCQSYGFRPGTDAFAGCLQNIDLDRSADRREVFARPGFGYGYGVGFGRRGWY